MKNLISFLLLVFSLSLVNASQPSSLQVAVEDELYTIHIGAFVRVKSSDFTNIRPYGFLYVEDYDQRLKRVYLGDFETEAAAKVVLAQVKTSGYPDAYVTRRNLAEGKEVAVIQIGAVRLGDRINWTDYAKAGPLLVEANGKQLRITVGTFADPASANARIGSVKKAGFTDAFVRTTNSRKVHRVTKFETGGGISFSDGLTTVKEEEATVPGGNSPDEIPIRLNTGKKNDDSGNRPKDIPGGYDDLSSKSPEPQGVSVPDIRKNVKRNSVIELQKVLKEAALYSGGLDGFYGQGTASAYQQLVAADQEIQKQRLILQHRDRLTEKGTSNILQHYINTLVEDTPKAIPGLESTSSPVARVYRAYALFRQGGDQAKLDYLMNSAIQETFKGKQLKDKPPFDYQSKYTYQDLDQLILHLSYVQAAADSELSFPCWLFRLHPEETAAAFRDYEREFSVEDCGDLMEWEELSLLESIASGLNPESEADQRLSEKYSSERSKLFLFPASTMDAEKSKLAEAWHQSLWKGLNAWEAADPLHKKLLMPFRVSYFQSMVLLEDYYMNEGFKPAMARNLATAYLQTIVGPHMKRYLR